MTIDRRGFLKAGAALTALPGSALLPGGVLADTRADTVRVLAESAPNS
ncbi:twin-arginine translocation signal domain-containing protein, partial [Acinetobacter baumannii]